MPFHELTSILEVLLMQSKSSTGGNKFSRHITPQTTDERDPKVKLDVYYVDSNSSKKFKSLS